MVVGVLILGLMKLNSISREEVSEKTSIIVCFERPYLVVQQIVTRHEKVPTKQSGDTKVEILVIVIVASPHPQQVKALSLT